MDVGSMWVDDLNNLYRVEIVEKDGMQNWVLYLDVVRGDSTAILAGKIGSLSNRFIQRVFLVVERVLLVDRLVRVAGFECGL